MENKYQEALDRIKKEHIFIEDYLKKEIDLLQELVDKETPMKPLNNGKMYKKGYRWQCPNCKAYLYEANSQTMRLIGTQKQYTHCAECGKKLDWWDINE